MRSNDLFQEAQHSFVEGDLHKSIELFSEAEAEGCNPVNVHLSMGAAFLQLKEYDHAIGEFEKVLEIDSDNERGYYYRGIAHLGKGEYENAEKDLTRSIERNHERGVAFFARGLVHAELGHEEEAVRDFKTAIAFSDVAVGNFMAEYGSDRTIFQKSLALIEGERGPLSIVLNENEVEKLKKWIE